MPDQEEVYLQLAAAQWSCRRWKRLALVSTSLLVLLLLCGGLVSVVGMLGMVQERRRTQAVMQEAMAAREMAVMQEAQARQQAEQAAAALEALTPRKERDALRAEEKPEPAGQEAEP